MPDSEASHSITIPVALAAELGLNEAVMLQIVYNLQTYTPHHTPVLAVAQTQLAQLTPFWSDIERRNALNSLQAKNCLQVDFLDDKVLISGTTTATAVPAVPTSPVPAAAPIHSDWQPRDSTYALLEHDRGVPRSFAAEQLDEFRLYWLDRNSTTFSWDSRFLRHVLRAWRNQQSHSEAQTAISQAAPTHSTQLHGNWQPSTDAVEILARGGIDKAFIEAAVPEFILYWRERGDSLKTWNSKFVAHVRRQWNRLQHNTEAQLITSDWQPRSDAYDVLAMAHIPEDFAVQQIPDFVLFWLENNRLYNSWSTRFVQHVKYQWAKHNDNTAKQTTGKDSRGFIEKHTDTSWREGL